MRGVLTSLALVAAFSGVLARPVFADEPPVAKAETVSKADKKAAAKEAAKAQKLDAAKNAPAAAEAWEKAFTLGKTPAHILKAARSRVRASESTRAANDYTRYLAVAAETDRGRKGAQRELAVLQAKLGRFEIRATGSSKLAVDGEVVDPALAASFHVTPGPHTVEATFDKRVAKEQATAVAGQSVAVVLAAPPEEEAPPPPPPPPESGTTMKASTKSDRPSLPPLAVYIGGGLTVLLGGLTVMSAIDVVSSKKTFDNERSQENLDEGKSKQLRTNILLASTGVVALGTAAIAIFLVDWKRADTKLGLGPGSIFLERSF